MNTGAIIPAAAGTHKSSDISNTRWRYVFLCFASFVSFGWYSPFRSRYSFYCYENPIPLAVQLKQARCVPSLSLHV